MDISPIHTSPAMAAAVRLTEVNYGLQAAIMKQIPKASSKWLNCYMNLVSGETWISIFKFGYHHKAEARPTDHQPIPCQL